jgi:hypothetical protein
MIMGNFIEHRAAVRSECLSQGIDVIHGEDGFFPHYKTLHVDPIGFCWESSIPRLIFKNCSDTQRKKSQNARTEWLKFKKKPLPAPLDHKSRYVMWPLQLLGDRVNRFGEDASSWLPYIKHFRARLPEEILLVIKQHPRGGQMKDIEAYAKKTKNVVYLTKRADLNNLMNGALAVAGVNSTVLTEARLMFNKPVYAYAESWFTNHTELIYPLKLNQKSRDLPYVEMLEDSSLLTSDELLQDYRDWYLYQLLIRQYPHTEVKKNKEAYLNWLHKFSYYSFKEHGEAIFE